MEECRKEIFVDIFRIYGNGRTDCIFVQPRESFIDVFQIGQNIKFRFVRVALKPSGLKVEFGERFPAFYASVIPVDQFDFSILVKDDIVTNGRNQLSMADYVIAIRRVTERTG